MSLESWCFQSGHIKGKKTILKKQKISHLGVKEYMRTLVPESGIQGAD